MEKPSAGGTETESDKIPTAEKTESPELIDFGPYPDPFVAKTPWNTFVFVFVDETKRKIYTKESPSFITLPAAPSKLIWEHPLEFTEVWAPELHFEQGDMFLHYSADRGDNAVYRSYVATGEAEMAIGSFNTHAEINLPGDTFAIDLTRVHINGDAYYVWSGWEEESNVSQKIFIGKVDASGSVPERHVISFPEYDWEKSSTAPLVRDGLNEGPQFFKKDAALPDTENLWMLISADASWTDQYRLGLLKYTGGDPADINSWDKLPVPVFQSTEAIFGPGHACVVEDENKEWWLLYHRARMSGSGWDRVARAQKISWHPEGTPEFGMPLDSMLIGRTAVVQTANSLHSTTP